jgi:Ran GTPase-activating protein (RanGAP) involved in mRNA processing and transport
VALLAAALKKNATLQQLDLGSMYGNAVGDAGAASLAAALEKNATLQHLDLYGNSVGDAGAASLAAALENNTTLQHLALGSNKVGDAGAESLTAIRARIAKTRAAVTSVTTGTSTKEDEEGHASQEDNSVLPPSKKQKM